MRVLMVEPGKSPYVTELKGDLKSMQEAVGGYIEGCDFYDDPVAIVCNENGKVDGLPLNRAIYDESGQMVEAIAGNFFVAGLGEEDFTDLSDEYMKKYSEMFKYPEEFVFLNGELTAIPMPVQEQATETVGEYALGRDFTTEYQLLDRLRSDCEYFLGNGRGAEKYLWAGNIDAQIAKMRELYDILPQKPEWLTAEDITRYEDAMQDLVSARKTVVVNLFAGPGAGKTTCAWEIASELKKRGIEAEYVSEYAKEFVWDGRTDILDGSLEHQKMLFTEQAHRINRLLGKVDVVVTDSPTILGLLYQKEPNSDFEAQVLHDFNGHKNFNLFINRGQVFQQAGRIHNAAESIAIDKRVQDFLQAHQIYYGTYYHSTVGVLVNNIIKNLANVNQKSQKRSTDCPAI